MRFFSTLSHPHSSGRPRECKYGILGFQNTHKQGERGRGRHTQKRRRKLGFSPFFSSLISSFWFPPLSLFWRLLLPSIFWLHTQWWRHPKGLKRETRVFLFLSTLTMVEEDGHTPREWEKLGFAISFSLFFLFLFRFFFFFFFLFSDFESLHLF